MLGGHYTIPHIPNQDIFKNTWGRFETTEKVPVSSEPQSSVAATIRRHARLLWQLIVAAAAGRCLSGSLWHKSTACLAFSAVSNRPTCCWHKQAHPSLEGKDVVDGGKRLHDMHSQLHRQDRGKYCNCLMHKGSPNPASVRCLGINKPVTSRYSHHRRCPLYLSPFLPESVCILGCHILQKHAPR